MSFKVRYPIGLYCAGTLTFLFSLFHAPHEGQNWFWEQVGVRFHPAYEVAHLMQGDGKGLWYFVSCCELLPGWWPLVLVTVYCLYVDGRKAGKSMATGRDRAWGRSEQWVMYFCTHVDHFVFSLQVSVTIGGTWLTNVDFGSFSYRSFMLFR